MREKGAVTEIFVSLVGRHFVCSYLVTIFLSELGTKVPLQRWRGEGETREKGRVKKFSNSHSGD